MKIFLSWSGRKSHHVARAFRTWIPQVIQSLKPFLSSVDIDKGDLWRERLKGELGTSNVGIFCITKTNMDAPWLNYEAGALSLGAFDLVCPFLLDVAPEEISEPLRSRQVTRFNKADFRQLMETLNARLGEGRLEEAVLGRSFDTYWPLLEEQLTRILEPDPADILVNSYEETVRALRESDSVVRATHTRLFQDILIRELADFRIKLKRWQQRRVVLVGHHYDDFLEKVYASARRTVFATCSEGDIESWAGRTGERLIAAHRKSPATVTRVFVFEDRDDIREEHKAIMRSQTGEGFEVEVYINNEDDFFHFPPDLNRDFAVIDEGKIIGKSSQRRGGAVSEWVFNDRDERDRFAEYVRRLRNGCLRENDSLRQEICSATPSET